MQLDSDSSDDSDDSMNETGEKDTPGKPHFLKKSDYFTKGTASDEEDTDEEAE